MASRAEGRSRTGTQAKLRPIIAVSRQYGARGAAVAKLVADRLGYAFWDRELIAAIAAHVRAEPAHIAALDERCHAPGAEQPAPATASEPGRAEYLRGLELVAHSIARRGGAVAVGRGIGFLLGRSDCLRVRVVCPLERRIAGLAERTQLSLESARATIDYVDRERRSFIHDRHGLDVDDPTAFDLVVSTGTLGVEAAADVVIGAYHARFDLRRVPRSTSLPPARETRSLADHRR